VIIGAGIVFAESGMNKGVVRRLVIDPQKEELPRLEVGLELKDGDLKGNSIEGERL
jgi:hypothetical protein